jgi:hypothetical protein
MEETYSLSMGVWCKGGVTVWNLRPWPGMVRETAQAGDPRGQNTDAPVRFGLLHSSDEAE